MHGDAQRWDVVGFVRSLWVLCEIFTLFGVWVFFALRRVVGRGNIGEEMYRDSQ